MNYYSLFFGLLLIVAPVTQKQFVSFDDESVSISRQDEIVAIVIPFEIIEGYHIQAVSEAKDNLIATEFSLVYNEAYTILSEEFTSTNYDTVILNQFTHRVLSNRLEMTVTLKLNVDVIDSELKLKGQLMYQACDDKQCYFPRTLNFVAKLRFDK